jgi:hypothetical protein
MHVRECTRSSLAAKIEIVTVLSVRNSPSTEQYVLSKNRSGASPTCSHLALFVAAQLPLRSAMI